MNGDKPQIMSYNPEILRNKARELLSLINSRDNEAFLNDIEMLIEDFNSYKIELEMQQEEISRANHTLEYQNRRLDDLFENAPVGYFIMDAAGLIIKANKTGAQMLHTTRHTLVGKSLNHFIHSSSQDRFYIYWRNILNIREPENIEVAFRDKGGNKEFFLLNCRPYRNKDEKQWYIRVAATNISWLKEADVLRESERRYRMLFTNMLNGMLILKPVFKNETPHDFIILRANDAAVRITEIALPDLEGKSAMKMFAYEKDEILALLQKTLKEKANQKLEKFSFSEDIYVNIHTFIPEDDYVALIIENVTTRVNLEREQQKSEKLLRTIFRILPVGVSVTDNNGVIIDCNTASENLLGLKKEKHLVRHVDGNEWKIIRKDFTPMPTEDFASVRAFKENRIIENIEMGLVKNKKNITWLNVSAAPIPLPEMGVAVVYSDITDRVAAHEETEEKFRNIIQNSTDAILIIDHKGVIIEWNKGCELIFGYSRTTIMGSKLWEFARKIKAGKLFSANEFSDALKTGMSDWFERINEITIVDAEKNKKILQYVVFPVKSANGNLLGIMGRDITEQKENEKVLKAAKEKAEEANKIKSQFLANISHEIRTPLNAIMGFTGILKEYPVEDNRFKSYLSGIEKSSKSLIALFNDILDLSRIDAGKMQINPVATNLSQLISDVKQIFSMKAEHKGLALDTLISPAVPAVVHLDEVRLRQILFNLVGNAVKFTQHGSIMIEADAIPQKDNHLVDIVLKVIDTGPGIDEKDFFAIFDPFFQKNLQQAAKLEGTGLGLAISRRFAELMNGKISVRSEKGTGTEFTLTLPDVPVSENSIQTNNLKNKTQRPGEQQIPALNDLIFNELLQKFGSHNETVSFLGSEVWSEYDKIADILGFEEVIGFTSLLMEISQKHDLKYLEEFASKLNKEAALFNVIEINRMLTSFDILRNKFLKP
jgi:PAS domain S-box-containing protein